ncbi:MAG TPA: hypothetical protein VM327_10105 [Candidatus Thermoplasmatota archaeon]|nr:hypothetical protein [Candidatus Thermoplasmatota archaeon]
MLVRTALAVSLLALGLAGCSSDPPAADDGTPTPADGSGSGPGPGAGDGAAVDGSAPQWTVGQWWDHKWFFGTTASEPFTVKTIVAEDLGPSFLVATDDNLTSALHGAFLFPTLGVFPKGEVTATVGDSSWPWYHFPLSDNQTWTDTIVSRDGSGTASSGFSITATVHAAAEIVTTVGTKPGFEVEARSAGKLFARYDYVPAIGWFSRATFYDVAATEETPQFILETSQVGQDYRGPYFDSVGDVLSTHFNLLVPTAPSPPNPTSTFAVTESHTQVLAVMFSFAAAGAHTTELVAPDGRHWTSFQASDQDGGNLDSIGPAGGLVFVPAVAGDWRVVTAGAGAFVAGGGLQAYGITQRAGQL